MCVNSRKGRYFFINYEEKGQKVKSNELWLVRRLVTHQALDLSTKNFKIIRPHLQRQQKELTRQHHFLNAQPMTCTD